MKIFLTLLVRNEEDLIQDVLAYHLSAGVDHIIVMDNMSEDRTPEILSEISGKTGRVTLLEQTCDDYAQGRWVTSMARMAAGMGADWIINGDADEFWWPNSSGDLKHLLGSLSSSVEAVHVERYNFVLRRGDLHLHPVREMVMRERQSFNIHGNPLPPKVCHRAFGDIVVSQGNHSVARNGTTLETAAADLEILHFPVRSYRQSWRKIELGGRAYARNKELDPSIGSTWRELYAAQLAGTFDLKFAKQTYSSDKIVSGLISGELIEDYRLRNFLVALSSSD